MSDLISRQAAIDALARMMPRSYTPDGSHPGDEEIFRAQEIFADCIEALEILPSVQPATNCSEIPNGSDDTISRQAAIGAIVGQPPEPHYPSWYAAQIEKLPAVQPEIIRCKDCKYWRDDHTCHEHSLVSPMCANEYCSRAERRRNEHID